MSGPAGGKKKSATRKPAKPAAKASRPSIPRPKKEPRAFLRACVREGRAYVPGEQPRPGEQVVKLNTNENPWPPSPSALECARVEARESLRRYPDPEARSLRAALAAAYGLDASRIVCGNGSDELLALLLRACVPEGGRVVSPTPTYSLYETLVALHGASFVALPFKDDYTLPKELFSTDADLVFLCNPNSPSGTALPAKEVERLADSLRGLLVVDEAYVEFADGDCLGLARDREDIVVVRSLSKSHSLAGLRVGWAYGSPTVIAGLDKLRDRYNLDRIAQSVASAAVLDQAWARENSRKVREERTRVGKELGRLGFSVWPSQSNFLLVRWDPSAPPPPAAKAKAQVANARAKVDAMAAAKAKGKGKGKSKRKKAAKETRAAKAALAAFRPRTSAGELAAALRARGVLVRHFALPRLDDCLRISIGRAEENGALLGALEDFLYPPPPAVAPAPPAGAAATSSAIVKPKAGRR